MRSRLSLESKLLSDRIKRGDPYWPAQLAVAVAIVLYLTLSEELTVGPKWLIPSIEGGLLVILIVVAPARATKHERTQRRLSLIVVALVSLMNIISLVLLVEHVLEGNGTNGSDLILSGVVLLGTNVLLFAVWYWEMDRGGPASRFMNGDTLPDFQFPQLENPQLAIPNWRPGFIDYLYVSITNSTAFSPTDAMPLTHSAKIVMSVQSLTALVTVVMVVARAINIL